MLYQLFNSSLVTFFSSRVDTKLEKEKSLLIGCQGEHFQPSLDNSCFQSAPRYQFRNLPFSPLVAPGLSAFFMQKGRGVSSEGDKFSGCGQAGMQHPGREVHPDDSCA